MRVGGQAHRHDEADSRFSQFLLKRLKMERRVTEVLRERITAALLTDILVLTDEAILKISDYK
jgi:hypothetical protein